MVREEESSGWQSNVGDVELNGAYFDPNNPKYRCLCHQCHSTIGMRILAGLLCLTVLLELWNLIWHILSTNQSASSNNMIISSIFQLFIGSAISATVIYSLKTENAAFLSPYLLLQAIGLAAVFVIFFAMTYIVLSNDLVTIKSFLGSHAPQIDFDDGNEQYLIYMGWTLVGSCAAIMALQFWLITITFSCWRFFRDKREFGYSKGYTSSFVILRPKPGSFKKEKADPNIVHRFIRSASADELINAPFKQPVHRCATASISYDTPTRDTIIFA
ncbi:hypothetical protein M3Y97_00371200 [Aphelenchoides bicaudatus]|nr:hypothetical protein M3Y97_00371200 [Aphelenchoides bicaudatus]